MISEGAENFSFQKDDRENLICCEAMKSFMVLTI